MEEIGATGALDGIRVLDLSRFIAGPYCAMLLGDMGADVIKVERPSGEDVRGSGPFKDGESLYVILYNRNKRGITLNNRDERGRRLLTELIEWADVIVENYRPGTMAAMGFDFESIQKINPRAILTSISGFGQTGPLRDRAVFDAIAQAMGGLMASTGPADGDPMLAGTFVADHVAGLHAAYATVSALMARERTGSGQLVDIALLDSLFSCMGPPVQAAITLGEARPRLGNRDSVTAPANLFRTADGHVYVHCGTNPLFRRFCEMIGRPELSEDPRFVNAEARVANVEATESLVSRWVGDMSTEAAAAAFEEAGIPAGPVLGLDQLAGHEQIEARGMIAEIEHSKLGPLKTTGVVAKLSGNAGSVRRAAPTIGEHTAEVLSEICGVTEAELSELRSDGVV